MFFENHSNGETYSKVFAYDMYIRARYTLTEVVHAIVKNILWKDVTDITDVRKWWSQVSTAASLDENKHLIYHLKDRSLKESFEMI